MRHAVFKKLTPDTAVVQVPVVKRSGLGMRVGTLCAIAVCTAQSAGAENSPVVGFFRYQFPDEVAGDETGQLGCAFSFFQQDAAGNGHDYLLDQDEFARTGKISYRIGTTFTCTYDAASQSEICQVTSPLEELNIGTVHYLYYNIKPNKVDLKTFGSASELRAAASARASGEVPIDLITFVRCDGLTAAALAPFIDKTPIDPSDQALLSSMENPLRGQAKTNLKKAQEIRIVILGH